MEEFKAGKWKIFPKKDMNEDLDESYIELVFRLKEDIQQTRQIKKEYLIQLKQDLHDLGKWRKFQELKKDLENEKKS